MMKLLRLVELLFFPRPHPRQGRRAIVKSHLLRPPRPPRPPRARGRSAARGDYFPFDDDYPSNLPGE